MIATLLTWLYISFLCWTWGILFFRLTRKTTKDEPALPHFSIICITGLSVITMIAGILSLFMPLGEWWTQFFFILPCVLIFFLKSVPYFFSSLKKQFSNLHISSLILLWSLFVLILVMSAWKIVHPDTLSYHAQTIQWIEKYKAIPGLVHLHVRFGYQGLWFVDCALFDFGFTGKQGLTFLNSTVLFWLLIFIVDRVDHNFFKERKNIIGFLWAILLLLFFWSYTQVRLTATSASPDFIATIFVLTIIYLLLEKGTTYLAAGDWIPVSLISIVAVTIKLSVAPILLIAIIAGLLFLIKKRIRAFVLLLLIAAVALTGFVTRNIITSGYIIFPSAAVDVADVDWKYSDELTTNEKNYITAYARKQGVATKEEIDSVNGMKIREWLPGWWKNRSVADKTILILFLVSLLAAAVFIRKIAYSGFIPVLVLITMLTGIIFWFINAPDPRFGFGFITGFTAIIAYLLFKEKKNFIGKSIPVAVLVAFSIAAISYTGYRFLNFFNRAQLIYPLGIESKAYETFECDGVKINSPAINEDFGTIPIPCTDLDCNSFSPRSSQLIDGFKTK